jgi:cytosine/adenosine deaminase-related metal-dependent hydrolase
MVDLLLAHGTVVTMNGSREVLEDASLAVSGDRICELGPAASLDHVEAARTIDCRGKLVVPGFVDAHGHGGHSLLRTLGTDTPTLWMRIVTPTYFHATTEASWYADGLLSALERLRAGVTCGVSVLGSAPRSDDPAIPAAHARAYEEVGLREVLCVGPAAPPWPRSTSTWTDGTRTRREVTYAETLEGLERAIETCDGRAAGRIRVFATPFTIVPSLDPSSATAPDVAAEFTQFDREQARRIREIAAKWNVRIHSDAFGGMIRLAARDDENALLGPDVHLQHCIGVALDEVEILADTGTHVGLAPIPFRSPLPALLQAGVNVAVTSDGAARRSFDLLQAARTLQFGHHLLQQDTFLLPVGKLLEMVTIDAAAALGMEDEVGSLEVGKKADVAVVDLRQPHLTPSWMVVHQLIYHATGADVETVVVDGKVLMEQRRILSVNPGEVLDLATREAQAIVERGGLSAHLTPPGWGRARRAFDRRVELPE